MSTPPSTVTIRAIDQLDRDQWVKLYAGYIAFYKREFDQNKVDTLWQWLDTGKIMGLAAIADGKLVGLAHYREMPSPLNACMVGFLDDFFVDPEFRGHDVAKALMLELNNACKKHGWPFIRWITAENNYRAKAFYDKIAKKTAWNTYQMDA